MTTQGKRDDAALPDGEGRGTPEPVTVEQALRVRLAELSRIHDDFINYVNASDVHSVFLDREMRVRFATPRAGEVLDLLPDGHGRPVSDMTATFDAHALHADLRRVLERLETVEREVETRDGRWYLARAAPYRTADDRIDGIVITFVDVSARRHAEAGARAGEERLRLLIDSAIDYAIFTMTANGKVDSWNPGAQRMFGFTADEIIGRSAALLFTPEDRAAGVPAAELARAAVDGRAEDERWHVRKDGSRLYCSGVTTRLGDPDRHGFAKIARDLTAHRQADLALREAHAALEERVRARTSQLQARVAQHAAAEAHVTSLVRRLITAQEDERVRIARDLHDQLGQQLVALRLVIERHQERCGSPEADGDLQKAIALASDIDREVDFLAWELRPAALDDLGLAAALPRFVEEWSRHCGIAAECHCTGVAPGQLAREHEVTFYRVAQEALNNVVKHAHANRVDVLLEARDGVVTLVVEDDGIGFDVKQHEASGAGVGLIGMRERATVIGGTLDIESSPGRGASVFLRVTAAR